MIKLYFITNDKDIKNKICSTITEDTTPNYVLNHISCPHCVVFKSLSDTVKYLEDCTSLPEDITICKAYCRTEDNINVITNSLAGSTMKIPVCISNIFHLTQKV